MGDAMSSEMFAGRDAGLTTPDNDRINAFHGFLPTGFFRKP